MFYIETFPLISLDLSICPSIFIGYTSHVHIFVVYSMLGDSFTSSQISATALTDLLTY